MDKRTRPMRDCGLIQSIIVGLTIVVLAAGTISGAPPIPVTTCPQNLNVAGGSYILTGNLICPGTALTISANDVKLSLNGFTLTAMAQAAELKSILYRVPAYEAALLWASEMAFACRMPTAFV